MTEHSEPIVSLEHVYKIFGPDPGGRAYDLSRAGVDKDEVQRLSGHVVGMKDISFTVNKGEIFVVMGLSGSGKSTAIRTVNKLHDITAGQVTVDGIDVQGLRGSALQTFRREKMGMVFQHFALFPHRNIIDNTGYGLKVQGVSKGERDAEALKALAMVGLEAYAQNAVGELSGGIPTHTLLPEKGFTMHVHESLLNNMFDRMNLAGRTMTEYEVREEMERYFSILMGKRVDFTSEAQDKKNEPDPTTFIFAEADPIRFQIGAGRIDLIIRAGLKQEGREDIPTKVITIPLIPHVEPDAVVVERGSVKVAPIGRQPGHIAHAGVIRKRMEDAIQTRRSDRQFSVSRSGKSDILMQYTAFQALNGWLTILAE